VHIANGRLIDPATALDTKQDIYLADGRIAAIGRAPQGYKADRTLDASGLIVCPGLVDLAVRLREPGF
jgi:dihydroorotase